MNGARRFMIGLYALLYGLSVWCGTVAVEDGDTMSAAGLFAASGGLLLGIHRECRHAARVIRLVGVYRHHQTPDPGHDQAVEYATAFPPGCRCETWWTSLGAHHHPACPAHTRTRRESP